MYGEQHAVSKEDTYQVSGVLAYELALSSNQPHGEIAIQYYFEELDNSI